MNNKTIYANQSQKLLATFVDAQTPHKVLLVPIDFAKRTHYVCFCDGHGQYIRGAFTVKNDAAGLDFLIRAIEKTRTFRKISNKQHVIIGGEDCASYTDNFMNRLNQYGYFTVSMNAHEVHRQCKSIDNSTDKTALQAIAKTMLNKDVSQSQQPDIYHNLRDCTRQRRRLVRLTTSIKNRIHTHADRLFPGFLSDKCVIAAFSPPCIELMKKSFSAKTISKKQLPRLQKQLERCGVKNAQSAAVALKEQASASILCNSSIEKNSHEVLQTELQLYECIEKSVALLNKRIAQILAQTPGAFLTTIRGMGITLVANIIAEIGDITTFKNLDTINAYAGIIPQVKQTGGPESQANISGKRKRYNRILKDYLLQAGNHIYLHGPQDLMLDAQRRKASGKAVETAMARRIIRISKTLIKTRFVYLPSELRDPNVHCDQQDRAQYILKSWPDWLIKWKRLGLQNEAFSPHCPLGQWRLQAQEIYDIKLPL